MARPRPRPISTSCRSQPPPDHQARRCRPTAPVPWLGRLATHPWLPPTFQELASCRYRMDHGHTVVVLDDADLQRFTCPGDAVLARRRLDVDKVRLRPVLPSG